MRIRTDANRREGAEGGDARFADALGGHEGSRASDSQLRRQSQRWEPLCRAAGGRPDDSVRRQRDQNRTTDKATPASTTGERKKKKKGKKNPKKETKAAVVGEDADLGRKKVYTTTRT